MTIKKSDIRELNKLITHLITDYSILIAIENRDGCLIRIFDNPITLTLILARSEALQFNSIHATVFRTREAFMAVRLAVNRLERRFRRVESEHMVEGDIKSVVNEIDYALAVYADQLDKVNIRTDQKRWHSKAPRTSLVRTQLAHTGQKPIPVQWLNQCDR